MKNGPRSPKITAHDVTVAIPKIIAKAKAQRQEVLDNYDLRLIENEQRRFARRSVFWSFIPFYRPKRLTFDRLRKTKRYIRSMSAFNQAFVDWLDSMEDILSVARSRPLTSVIPMGSNMATIIKANL